MTLNIIDYEMICFFARLLSRFLTLYIFFFSRYQSKHSVHDFEHLTVCWIDYFRINVLYIFYEIGIANNRTWVPDTSFASHVLLAWPEMLAKSDYGFAFECLVTWLLISLIHWCHFLSVWARVKHPACTSTFPQEEYCTFII